MVDGRLHYRLPTTSPGASTTRLSVPEPQFPAAPMRQGQRAGLPAAWERSAAATATALRGGAQAAPRHLGPVNEPLTPVDAARVLARTDTEHPEGWTAVERTFRDGHLET